MPPSACASRSGFASALTLVVADAPAVGPGEQDAAEREGDGGGEDIDEGDDWGGEGGHGW